MLAITLSSFVADAQVYGDYPYNQSFLSATQPPEVTKPTGAETNSATFTTTGLRLTPAEGWKFGAIFINNKTFNSAVGIKISFEYSIYGSTSDYPADGIIMFLYDASATPVIGPAGRSFGYSYLRANEYYSENRGDGLTGAYLGVALDSWGNFKGRFFQEDARVNGISTGTQGTTTTGIGGEPNWNNTTSHVTLRGARGKQINNNGLALGRTGYPVLRTQGTLSPAASANGGAILNTNGSYTMLNGISTNFNLRSGVDTADPNNDNFRKAFIDLLPNAAGGFNITVKIRHGATTTTVIDNYWYRASTNMNYMENANPSSTDFNYSNTQGNNTLRTIDSTVPTSFKMGFAATTGGYNDIHKIWNLSVVMPYAAEAGDDVASTCKVKAVQIDPYTNDVAYVGPTYGTPVASNANIDYTSFRFLNDDNTPSATPYSLTNAQGTFTYNSTTGKVTFLPKQGYVGTASVSYRMKGKNNGANQPYGDDGFLSNIATIYVKVSKCQVITNPMLPSKSNQKS